MSASRGYDDDSLPASVWYLIVLALVIGFILISLLAVSVLNGQGDEPGTADAAEKRSAKLPPTWTVRRGDSYSSIAAKTGLTITDLETFNPRTNPDTIMPGQRLKLRLHLPKAKPAPLGPRFWKVRRGQSFGSIAAATGKSMATLRRLNPKVKAGEIQPGDRIRLRR